MKTYDKIEPGAPVLNPDGDLCVALFLVSGIAGSRDWRVAIIPGNLGVSKEPNVHFTRLWYDEKDLTLLAPAPRIDPGKLKAADRTAGLSGFKPPADRGAQIAADFLGCAYGDMAARAAGEPEVAESSSPSPAAETLSDEDLQVAIESTISALRPARMGASLAETVRNRLGEHLDQLLMIQQLRAAGAPLSSALQVLLDHYDKENADV